MRFLDNLLDLLAFGALPRFLLFVFMISLECLFCFCIAFVVLSVLNLNLVYLSLEKDPVKFLNCFEFGAKI